MTTATKLNLSEISDVQALRQLWRESDAETRTEIEAYAAERFPKPEDVPAGWYAVRYGADGEHIKFYVVQVGDKGKWTGFRFVSVQASDQTYPVRGQGKYDVLKAIAADTQAAAQLYGQKIGKCGVCGRTLTNKVSRDYGIGPDCRDKTGF